MNIIKKLFYIIRNKFHHCKLCQDGQVTLTGYQPNQAFEKDFYADNKGELSIVCPKCKGTKIVWGE